MSWTCPPWRVHQIFQTLSNHLNIIGQLLLNNLMMRSLVNAPTPGSKICRTRPCSAGWELCSDHTPAYHTHDSSDYLRLHLLYVCMLGYLVSTNHSTVQAYSSVWLLYICSCWDILYLPVTQAVRAYPHYDIILRYLRIILIQITQSWDTLTIRFTSTWQFAD